MPVAGCHRPTGARSLFPRVEVSKPQLVVGQILAAPQAVAVAYLQAQRYCQIFAGPNRRTTPSSELSCPFLR